MKKYLSFPDINFDEVAAYVYALCKELNIECSKSDVNDFVTMGDIINSIASKHNIRVNVGNELHLYPEAVNTIINHLVSSGILNEKQVLSEVDVYLKQF